MVKIMELTWLNKKKSEPLEGHQCGLNKITYFFHPFWFFAILFFFIVWEKDTIHVCLQHFHQQKLSVQHCGYCETVFATGNELLLWRQRGGTLKVFWYSFENYTINISFNAVKLITYAFHCEFNKTPTKKLFTLLQWYCLVLQWTGHLNICQKTYIVIIFGHPITHLPRWDTITS